MFLVSSTSSFLGDSRNSRTTTLHIVYILYEISQKEKLLTLSRYTCHVPSTAGVLVVPTLLMPKTTHVHYEHCTM